MMKTSDPNLLNLSLQDKNIVIFPFGSHGPLYIGTSFTFHDCRLTFTKGLFWT